MTYEASACQNESEELVSIAEFALLCNVSKSQLRNWDELLDPVRRERGSRWYRKDQKDNVEKIKDLLSKGHSLADTQKIMQGDILLDEKGNETNMLQVQSQLESALQNMGFTDALMLIGSEFKEMKNELIEYKEQNAQISRVRNDLVELKKINSELHQKLDFIEKNRENRDEERARKVDEALMEIRAKFEKKNEPIWQRIFKKS